MFRRAVDGRDDRPADDERTDVAARLPHKLLQIKNPVRRAAERLVTERLMLREDADAAVDAARAGTLARLPRAAP